MYDFAVEVSDAAKQVLSTITERGGRAVRVLHRQGELLRMRVRALNGGHER